MPGKKRKQHVVESSAESEEVTTTTTTTTTTTAVENETALNNAARKVFAEMRAIKQKKEESNSNNDTSKTNMSKKNKSKKKGKKPKKGVIYLGHIPHGFYEDQMRSFFSQFGEVTRLRLSRNKKTGRSKSYAYIEFDSAEDASIVARTMNGYILVGRVLVCHTIPAKKVHPDLFKGAEGKFKLKPWRLIAKQRQNADRNDEQKEKMKKRALSKEEKKRQKLQALGIDYDFSGYSNKTMEVDTKKKTTGSKAKKGKKKKVAAVVIEKEEEEVVEKPKKKRAKTTTKKKAATKKPKAVGTRRSSRLRK